MRKISNILVVTVLLSVFSVFSIGLPIVHYLCPMMNQDMPTCPYTPQSKDLGVSFTNETPSCCGSYIVAERNTTPYTSVERYSQTLPTVFVCALPVVANDVQSCFAEIVPFRTSASPPLRSEPLFILNSSILI